VWGELGRAQLVGASTIGRRAQLGDPSSFILLAFPPQILPHQILGVKSQTKLKLGVKSQGHFYLFISYLTPLTPHDIVGVNFRFVFKM
jgi:hypothetical protein